MKGRPLVSALPKAWATPCPEAIRHSIPDRLGKCMYCGRKIDVADPPPAQGTVGVSELTEAYNEFYDPDHGSLTWKQIQSRYAMGQE